MSVVVEYLNTQRVVISHYILKYPMAENKSLCERLGGEPAIKAVVDKFYDYMLTDDRVKEFFKNSDMQKQRKRQTDFITMACGGPNHYEGVDMKKAHLNMKISHMHFDATWENLEKALHDFKVSEDLIKEVKEVFYSVEEDIIEVK